MKQNPYETPAETADVAELGEPIDPQAVRYRGGWPAVAGIGSLGGVMFLGVLYVSETINSGVINPFVMIAALWFSAFVAVMMLLRGTLLTTQGRVLTALLLTPIGFALYVPICSFSTMALSGGIYDVGWIAMTASSIISFMIVLTLIASIVRSFVLKNRKRAQRRYSQTVDLP